MAAAVAEHVQPEGVEPAKLGRPMVFGPPPSAGPPEAAVLWLHGFGDKPDGWSQLLFPLRKAAPPRWRWLHLRAPKVAQPAYKGAELPGWGQFHSSQCLRVGGADYEDEDASGSYAASVAAVHHEIGLLEKEGVDCSKILLAGFSQGAAVAVESALTYPRRVAGVAALSGWLTRRARAAVAARKHVGMPILFCHGTKDDMVGVDCSEAALRAFEEAASGAAGAHGAALELFKGLKHSSCPRELSLVATFVHRSIVGAAAADVVLTVPQWEAGGTAARGSDDEAADSDAASSSGDGDVVFVVKRRLEAVRQALSSGAAVDVVMLQQLLDYEGLADEEALVPLDVGLLSRSQVSVDDLAACVRLRGVEAVARAFVEAGDKPAEFAEGELDGEELTVGKLAKISAASPCSEEGEEEELLEGDEEEDAEADLATCRPCDGAGAQRQASGAAAPAAKRPRRGGGAEA